MSSPVHKACTGAIENTDLLCFFSIHSSVRYNKQNMQSPFLLFMLMFNAMHKRSLCPRAMSVHLSVRPSVTFVYVRLSVRPSVTFVYYLYRNE